MKRRTFIKGLGLLAGSLFTPFIPKPEPVEVSVKPELTTEGLLDNWADMIGIVRCPSESDASLRKRLMKGIKP
ncbi:MAG: hypothetical protein KAS30_01760 [Candidatus Diapherotrites archaeon]|nr:hypothetical protein [Candidatus Diapherotrites archaeon]